MSTPPDYPQLVEEAAHAIAAEALGLEWSINSTYDTVTVPHANPEEAAVIAFAGMILRRDLTTPASANDLAHVTGLAEAHKQVLFTVAMNLLVAKRPAIIALVRCWQAESAAAPDTDG